MRLKQEDLRILSNKEVSANHYIIEFESARIASRALPGQFVRILVDESYDPLLPRPFSVLDAEGSRFKILYRVIGKGTLSLSRKKKGEVLGVLGPLGNGFRLRTTDLPGGRAGNARQQIIIVGGGVGIPPLYHLARTVSKRLNSGVLRKDVHIFLGARRRAVLHCEEGFRKLGCSLHVATEDGSKGHKGFITDVLDKHLKDATSSGGSKKRASLYACGPIPMLKAVSALSSRHLVACQVSVEEIMPCGFGACLGCAVKLRRHPGQDAGELDYRYAMSCSEGPVFDAAQILWD